MSNDQYSEPEIIRGENYIVTVHSPILTEKERERRMKLIIEASVALVLSEEKRS